MLVTFEHILSLICCDLLSIVCFTIFQEVREHTARQKLEEKIKRDSTIMTKISDQSSEASENQKWAEEKMRQAGSFSLF